MANELPGAAVLVVITWPDKSVADGSVQNTVAEFVPTSMTSAMLVGQFEIVGGVVSTVKTKKIFHNRLHCSKLMSLRNLVVHLGHSTVLGNKSMIKIGR